MVAALHKAGEELIVPDNMRLRQITEEEFENMLKAKAGRNYDNYGMISSDLVAGGPGGGK